MEHHVCKGTCGAVSEQPGVCSAEGCTHKGEAFEKCDCGDMSAHKKDDDMDMGTPDDTTDEDRQ